MAGLSGAEVEGADRLRIGQATVSDLGAIATLAFAHYGGALDVWRDQLRVGVLRQDGLFLVAKIDDVVVGYGKAHYCRPGDDSDPAPAGYYLTGMIVDHRWRRRGIGGQLIELRTQWIWSHRQPAWFFANARNAQSLGVHADFGFTEVLRAPAILGQTFDGGVGVLCRVDPPAAPS